MEEVALNVTEKEALELSIGFPITPLRNRVIVTVNTSEGDELDLVGAGLSETQFVLAKGDHVSDDIRLGSKVLLDLDKMAVRTGEESYEIKVDPVQVGERVYAFVYDSSIKAVDNR